MIMMFNTVESTAWIIPLHNKHTSLLVVHGNSGFNLREPVSKGHVLYGDHRS